MRRPRDAMPLVRVTPENAVDTVHDQVEDFRETIAAAGRSPAFGKLAAQADELAAVIAAASLEAELLALDDLHPQWTGPLAHWLGVEPAALAAALSGEEPWRPPGPAGGDGVVLVSVRTGRGTPGRRAGDRVPPVLVIAHGSRQSPDQAFLEEIMAEMRRRPLSLILGPADSDWARALAGLGSREDWVAKHLPLEKVTGPTLRDNFARPPWVQAGRMACAWSVTGALASLQKAFSVLLDKEDRSLGAKKAALEGRSALQGSTANPSEVLGELRNHLQKRFEGFQKSVATELNDLVAPHDGSLSREVAERIEGIGELAAEKKPKFDVMTVHRETEQGLLGRVSDVLGRTLRIHWTRMREMLRDAEERVEEILESKGAPPVTLHFDYLPEQRVQNIVERAVVLQRPYKGEITRRGPMDYFMAARRYQMLFFMVFSAFGLSFIRSYREFTIPMGVLLLAFGMLNVVNAARKQRAEAEEKELKKARESLAADMSRAMSEVKKNWEQTVSAHLAAQQSAALETVEATVKSAAEAASRESASQKELAQQQMRGLDAAQRKLTDGVRKSEAAAQDLESLSAQLIEFYGTIVSPAEAGAAAAPGGGAAAAAGAAGGAAADAFAKAKAAAEAKLKQAAAGKPAGGAAARPGVARPGAARSGTAAKGGGDAKPGAATRAARLKEEAAKKLAEAKAKAGKGGAGKGGAGKDRPGGGRSGPGGSGRSG